MRDIIERLFFIARSRIKDRPRPFNGFRSWDKAKNSNGKSADGAEEPGHAYFSDAQYNTGDGSDDSSSWSAARNQPASEIPREVIDDLALFNLSPPSSLQEVRQARNREIRKYHSDKFIRDSEKFETSKEIMQIYNAAYERLEEYYNKTDKK